MYHKGKVLRLCSTAISPASSWMSRHRTSMFHHWQTISCHVKLVLMLKEWHQLLGTASHCYLGRRLFSLEKSHTQIWVWPLSTRDNVVYGVPKLSKGEYTWVWLEYVLKGPGVLTRSQRTQRAQRRAQSDLILVGLYKAWWEWTECFSCCLVEA